MFSIKSFHEQYETDESQVAVNGRPFRLLVPRTIEAYIDPEDPTHRFPLWAKIWEASLILADYMARQNPDPEQRVLEIGSGLGVVGIAASAFGHRITATEYNADALAFTRANALLNECSTLDIVPLDWHKPDLTGKFHRIIGSDVVYKEADFEPLKHLFETFLEPAGEIILASGMRKTDMIFFGEMQKYFTIKVQKKTLRSDDNAKDILLCLMTPRKR